MPDVTVLTFWGGQPWGFREPNLWKNQSSAPNNNIQKVSMSINVYVTFFNENIFYTEKAAILKVYFRKSLKSQLLLGNFQKKIMGMINLTSSIRFCQQIARKFSKFIQKNCKIWVFWYLLRQFPEKLEVIQQNGYDLWNQHPLISLKRIFLSL